MLSRSLELALVGGILERLLVLGDGRVLLLLRQLLLVLALEGGFTLLLFGFVELLSRLHAEIGPYVYIQKIDRIEMIDR